MINIFNLFMLQYTHSFFYGLQEAVPVKTITSDILQGIGYNRDRKTPLRAISSKWLEENSPPTSDDYNIASPIFALRTKTVHHTVAGAPNEIMKTPLTVIVAGGLPQCRLAN
jgi:hypothetical protein